MNPSILPPLMSRSASTWSCGPPAFRLDGSWKGLTHACLYGSGTQTVGTPLRIGMPSAPGNVPKYESNDRFSCMIITTCLILWIPVAAVDALVDPCDGGDPLDEQAVAKTTTTAAIPTNRADQERIRRTLRAARG